MVSLSHQDFPISSDQRNFFHPFQFVNDTDLLVAHHFCSKCSFLAQNSQRRQVIEPPTQAGLYQKTSNQSSDSPSLVNDLKTMFNHSFEFLFRFPSNEALIFAILCCTDNSSVPQNDVKNFTQQFKLKKNCILTCYPILSCSTLH